MAQSVFDLNVATEYDGIDAESSAIDKDSGGVNRAVNYEAAISNSLRGRVGCQIAAQTGNFFGIFPYSYTRTQDEYDINYHIASGTYPNQQGSLGTIKTLADGASITKVITINQQVWTLDTMNFVVGYVSGSYPFTWYTTIESSTNTIHFIIKANGVVILDQDLGDGLSSTLSIYSLLNNIDATSQLQINRTIRGTCPPFAVINGNQTSSAGTAIPYGAVYSLIVNAGHNFSAGDIITFPDATLGLAGGFVTSTTGTSITYAGASVTVANGTVLGYMGQLATSFPISTVSSAASGNLTISFPYWRLIPEGDNPFGFIYDGAYSLALNKGGNPFYAPPNSTSAQGDLFIAASSLSGTSGCATHLVKVDSLTANRAGLGTPALTGAIPGVGVLVGSYNYKAFIRRVDAQGNVVEGPLSPIITFAYATNYGQITATAFSYSTGTGWQTRSCFKNTAESPAANAYFYVDDNQGTPGTAFLQPGDPVYLTDNTAQLVGLWHQAFGVDVLGTLHKTVCTDYCPKLTTISPTSSSIRVADSSGYTIPDNSEISNGLTIVFLRTTAGGNQYYYLCEMPYSGYGPISFFDNVTDTVLAAQAQYLEVTLGKEHNPPPSCSIITQHQGLMVVGRGARFPNTVAFSTADGIEYFPTASNSFDVPSTQAGLVTALASDTSDMLAVFKNRAYYNVQGDLDAGTFSVQVNTEGDYGIVNQASILRMTDSLIGLSQYGLIIIQGGNFNQIIFGKLNARMINQPYKFQWATAVNDSFNRCILFSIPTSTTPVEYVVDYSKQKTAMSQALSSYAALGVGKGTNFDSSYMNLRTFERSYPSQIDQAGGGCIINEVLYHLSSVSPYGVFRRLDRFTTASPSGTGNNGDSFYDNTQAISYILETQPITLDEPALLKTPIRVRIWSIPNNYVVDGWVPFSFLIETGSNASTDFVGSGFPLGVASTITFLTADTAFIDTSLIPGKTHFYIFRLTTNAVQTAPFFTGFNIEFKPDYNKEDLQP